MISERPQNKHLIPAKKGEVRNPKGKPKGTLNSKTILNKFLALEEELANPVTGQKEKMNLLEVIYLQQIKNARRGDLKAMREIVDRLEGKAAQSVDLTTDGKPLPTPIYGGLSGNPDDIHVSGHYRHQDDIQSS